MSRAAQPTGSRTRRRWPFLVGGVVLLAVVAFFAVPYVYVHFINKPAKPLSFAELDKQRAKAAADTTAAGGTTAGTDSTTAGVAAGASSSDVSGSWKVTSPSSAGYRIKETLAGQASTAVGRTTKVDGTVDITGTKVTAADLSVDLTSVTSNESRRDAQFQGRIMDTAEFPVALFSLTQPIDLGTLPAAGATVKVTAQGTLTLKGVEKPVSIPLSARRNGAVIEVSGSTDIVFADYGIDNPSVGGFVTTEDHGTLEFLVTLAKA